VCTAGAAEIVTDILIGKPRIDGTGNRSGLEYGVKSDYIFERGIGKYRYPRSRLHSVVVEKGFSLFHEFLEFTVSNNPSADPDGRRSA
jgi:hypothetical protein